MNKDKSLKLFPEPQKLNFQDEKVVVDEMNIKIEDWPDLR